MTKINVDFKDGRGIFQMDESELTRKDSVIDDVHEHTEVIEYFLKGKGHENLPAAERAIVAVHRSVSVGLK
jgi:hypothetical protein